MDLRFADPSFFADLKLLQVCKYVHILFLLTDVAYNVFCFRHTESGLFLLENPEVACLIHPLMQVQMFNDDVYSSSRLLTSSLDGYTTGKRDMYIRFIQ